jgi:hypothetical protein
MATGDINAYIHEEVIKGGLDYFVNPGTGPTKRNFVLCLRNDDSDTNYGTSFDGKGGFFGMSYNNNNWTTLQATYNPMSGNSLSISFTAIDPNQTTISVPIATPAGKNEVKFFSILVFTGANVDLASAATTLKIILTYPLENTLTLNDGSKFSFSNFTITNSLTTP